MKILVVGASGTIGASVVKHFKKNHKVISASRSSSDLQVDITSKASIRELFNKIGQLDAVINCAGAVKWADFNDMSEDDFYVGIKSKLMGQVNLVRIAKKFLNTNGSLTLITGILGDDPVYQTTGAALVNGAINSFVKATAYELPNGIRINAVSPGLVEDSKEKFSAYFPGHNVVSMERVTNGFIKSVEGRITGEVIRIY